MTQRHEWKPAVRACLAIGLWLLAAGAGPATTMATETGESGESPQSRTLYLIRHGDYDHEDDRDPNVGKALVPLGVAQARLVAARLRGMPVTWSALHSSTMTRARETARVIGQDLGLEVESSRLLRECTPPTRRADVMEGETPEDLAACRAQIDAAFAQYVVPSSGVERHEILVGHGNVIRSFVTRALGVDPEAWLGMSIGNCSLTVLHVSSDGSIKVLAFSDLGHIPPNLQTRTAPGAPADLRVP